MLLLQRHTVDMSSAVNIVKSINVKVSFCFISITRVLFSKSFRTCIAMADRKREFPNKTN